MIKFLKKDLLIYMREIVWQMIEENDIEERKFLAEEYFEYSELNKLYDHFIKCNKDTFSWKYCLDEGWLSLYDLGHFKDLILKEVSEDEWKKHVEKEYVYMGKENTEKYLLEYDEYRKKHA